MRKSYLLVSLSLLSTAYGRYYCPPGIDDHLKFRADGMYLRRSNFAERTLVQNTSVVDAAGKPRSILKSNHLAGHWGWKPAAYGNLTYVKSEKSSLEALYYYVFPWHAREVTGAPATLAFPFRDPTFTTDYNNASFVEAKYISQFQNGELNYWRHLTPRRIDYFSASWILGFRFMFLREKMNLTFTQSTDISDFRTRTRNFLYGLQLGAVFEVNPSRRWTWTVIVKGAGFGNEAFAKVFLGDQNNTLVLRDFHKRRWAPAFLIEGIGSLTYQIWEHLNIHAGYQAFLATGFALAPKQMQKKSGVREHVRVASDMVLDGAFAGLTLGF